MNANSFFKGFLSVNPEGAWQDARKPFSEKGVSRSIQKVPGKMRGNLFLYRIFLGQFKSGLARCEETNDINHKVEEQPDHSWSARTSTFFLPCAGGTSVVTASNTTVNKRQQPDGLLPLTCDFLALHRRYLVRYDVELDGEVAEEQKEWVTIEQIFLADRTSTITVEDLSKMYPHLVQHRSGPRVKVPEDVVDLNFLAQWVKTAEIFPEVRDRIQAQLKFGKMTGIVDEIVFFRHVPGDSKDDINATREFKVRARRYFC